MRPRWYAPEVSPDDDEGEPPSKRYRFFRPAGRMAGIPVSIDLESRSTQSLGLKVAHLEEVQNCFQCDLATSRFEPMLLPDTLTLPVVTESILSSMPPIANHVLQEFLPAGGRRLLAFSDSRRQAARLGPHLTQQHEILLARTVIQRTLIEDPIAPATLDR
jgi:hypothetical protein